MIPICIPLDHCDSRVEHNSDISIHTFDVNLLSVEKLVSSCQAAESKRACDAKITSYSKSSYDTYLMNA